MTEQDYERVVDRLAQRFENDLLQTAVASLQTLPESMTDEEKIDETRERIEVRLFNDLAWEPVKATDISDIALDATERGWATIRAWN